MSASTLEILLPPSPLKLPKFWTFVAVYQNQYDEGDTIIHKGRFVTILGVSEDDSSVEYKISEKGKLKWTDAALVDRSATEAVFSEYSSSQ